MYDGLMLGFGEKEILKGFYNDNVPKCAEGQIAISGFLLVQGPERFQTEVFHLTNTFKEHLKDLLRAIAGT